MAITPRRPDSAVTPAREPRDRDALMTLAQRSDLVLTAARVLYVNGQTTDQTLAGAERIARALRLRTTTVARWGELQLQPEDEDARLDSVVEADPSGVNMTRAASMARTIEDLDAGRVTPAGAMKKIDSISHIPRCPPGCSRSRPRPAPSH